MKESVVAAIFASFLLLVFTFMPIVPTTCAEGGAWAAPSNEPGKRKASQPDLRLAQSQPRVAPKIQIPPDWRHQPQDLEPLPPPPPAQPPQPPPPSSSYTKEPVEMDVVAQLESLSRDYYEAMIRGDKWRLLSLYAFPMDQYFSKTYATRSFVENDINDYFSKWSNRTATLSSLTYFGSVGGSGSHMVRLVYEYSFVTRRGQPKRGVSTTDLLWTNLESVWKITSTYETVQRHVQ